MQRRQQPVQICVGPLHRDSVPVSPGSMFYTHWSCTCGWVLCLHTHIWQRGLHTPTYTLVSCAVDFSRTHERVFDICTAAGKRCPRHIQIWHIGIGVIGVCPCCSPTKHVRILSAKHTGHTTPACRWDTFTCCRIRSPAINPHIQYTVRRVHSSIYIIYSIVIFGVCVCVFVLHWLYVIQFLNYKINEVPGTTIQSAALRWFVEQRVHTAVTERMAPGSTLCWSPNRDGPGSQLSLSFISDSTALSPIYCEWKTPDVHPELVAQSKRDLIY